MRRNTIQIRRASKKDFPRVLKLVRELAKFEKLTPPGQAAMRRYLRHGFGAKRYFQVLVVERGGEMVGYAFYFFTYSTFLARPSLYLEDIFILPAFRRLGLGERVLRALARIARKEGCGRMEWCVLDWNVKAIRFYNKLGARHLKEWYFYRLDTKGIEKLANRDRFSSK